MTPFRPSVPGSRAPCRTCISWASLRCGRLVRCIDSWLAATLPHAESPVPSTERAPDGRAAPRPERPDVRAAPMLRRRPAPRLRAAGRLWVEQLAVDESEAEDSPVTVGTEPDQGQVAKLAETL